VNEVDEVLKFDPGPNFKRPSQDDIVREVLKFDPMRPKEEPVVPVGGTFQPKPSPIPGGTSPISTITGKPETRFISGKEPGAGFVSMMKGSFVDDPYVKARIFSESRGIPVSRYRVNPKGDIEFKDDQGNWQREVSEMPIHKLKQTLANIIAHPSTTLGTIGAIFGSPKGAIVGAMGGETLRKGIAAGVYGEKQTAFGNLVDVGMEGLFALGGEMVGKILTGGVNRFLTRKAKTLRLAGQEVREQLLSPEDHAKALWVQKLADQHNVTLAPHQLYDKEGMTNVWKYLRKHPVTSDAVKTFEDNLAKQSDEAINGFIKDMGGFEKTPYTLGTRTKEVAGEAISEAIEKRSLAASPVYQKAFKKAPPVDIEPVINFIDDKLKTAKGNVRSGLIKAKKLLEVPDLPKTQRESLDIKIAREQGFDVPVTQKPQYDTSLKGLHDAKISIDDEIAKAEKARTGNVAFNYKKIQKTLLDQMDKGSPEYAQARRLFASKSDPVNRLKESVIGELSKLKTDKTLSGVATKLLNIKNMPDETLLKEAKNVIFKKDPDLWDEIIGSYVRDVYQNLRIAEEGGKVLNVPGKMYKALYGNLKQRGILKVAMSPDQFKSFESLMQVFQRASIGTGKESMTAPLQAIGETMGAIPGSKVYRYAMFPRQAITETIFSKWNNILVSGRQKELMKALASPDVIKKLEAIKPLRPGSKKFIEAFSVFTALIADKVEMPERQ